ncbi:hypothetical protein GEV27_15950 [Aeromicrobium sp. S22]|uniref:hypothetical protein n=1 Tax=Aeromicrobium sp. S22 TaxID=2662029 RepID=UPI00129E5061|nr:hypothetical protein [Aeromicrobium sp. S22]MRK03012.1 hypothetical protein [Aeromicrobium sp. S22]
MRKTAARTSSKNATAKADTVVAPYAGGGGGSVLGHRIATIYLANMLLGGGRPETDELPITGLEFQTSPKYEVDDVIVRAGNDAAELRLHLAGRRRPNFVKSHEKTIVLLSHLLADAEKFGRDERAYVAIGVADLSPQYREVQSLTSLARDNANEAVFHDQVHTDGRHSALKNRYGHFKGIVQRVRPDATETELRDALWLLFNRLWVLVFRVEPGDETDWTQVATQLNPISRDGTSGAKLRDRLHSDCGTRFDIQGTVVDKTLVRRRAHDLIDQAGTRDKAAWARLNERQQASKDIVRSEIYRSSGDPIRLPRPTVLAAAARAILEAGHNGTAALITGESGTGKSSVTLEVAEAFITMTDVLDAIVLNLRRLPETLSALSTELGQTVETFLNDLSLEARVLVIDGAEAAQEGRGPLLTELAAAAQRTKTGLVLVSSETAADDVAARIVATHPQPKRVAIPALTDEELTEIAEQIPAIAGVIANVPPVSLYRRLTTIDLLARTGTTVSKPLDDWSCVQLVWNDLIRRDGAGPAFGSPESRMRTMLAIAEQNLDLPAEHRAFATTDPDSVDRLRQDLLIAPSDPMQLEPQFAHDEIRRFSTAFRLLPSNPITKTLNEANAPRWALSAAKLAAQGQLCAATDPATAFTAMLSEFKALGEQYTPRWKDVPLEAALEVPAADIILKTLQAGPGTDGLPDLDDLVRVARSHTSNQLGLADATKAEPVAARLVDCYNEPWDMPDESFVMLREWLLAVALTKPEAGNRVRLAIRDKLIAHWETHFDPTPPPPAPKPMRSRVDQRFFDRGRLPYEITRENFVALLALIGKDGSPAVAAVLRAIASDRPSHLSPAVDDPVCARGLAQYDPALLAELVEAHYIDTREDDHGYGRYHNGIRDHQAHHGRLDIIGSRYDGPFWMLINHSPVDIWAPTINRILNHAAGYRAGARTGASGGQPTQPDPAHLHTMNLTGEDRTYVGDSEVWAWYRGRSNAPRPCESALGAIELAIDLWHRYKGDSAKLYGLLLKDCQNLAIPGVIAGSILRHFEPDTTDLDLYLAEPLTWICDMNRSVSEYVGLRGLDDREIVGADRRKMSLRDAATILVLNGTDERKEQLRAIGEKLTTKAEVLAVSDPAIAWSSALDSNRMTVTQVTGGHQIEYDPPAALAHDQEQMAASAARNSTIYEIQNRYVIFDLSTQPDDWQPPTPARISDDLTAIQAIYESSSDDWTAADPIVPAAGVASAAIEATADGFGDALAGHAKFAVDLVLAICARLAGEHLHRDREIDLDLGSQKAAASALPKLLLPELADALAEAGVTRDQVLEAADLVSDRASVASCLAFVRAADSIWERTCTHGTCIHIELFDQVINTGRHAEVVWSDDGYGNTTRPRIEGALYERLREIAPDRLDTFRLSATIRGAGRAAASTACVSAQARNLLDALLTAQQLAILEQSKEDGFRIDHTDPQLQCAARALLHTSNGGTEPGKLLAYVTPFVGLPDLLGGFLSDLGGVGCETDELAAATRAIWPTLMAHLLDELPKVSDTYRANHDFSTSVAISYILPSSDGASGALHLELGHRPKSWIAAEDVIYHLPSWLEWAQGRSWCVIHLLSYLGELPVRKAAEFGIPWLAKICKNPHDPLVAYTNGVADWVIGIRPEAEAAGLEDAWQHLVDQLVVAGNMSLAKFSR